MVRLLDTMADSKVPKSQLLNFRIPGSGKQVCRNRTISLKGSHGAFIQNGVGENTFFFAESDFSPVSAHLTAFLEIMRSVSLPTPA